MIATPSVSQSKSQMVKRRGMTISKNVTRLNHLKAIDFWKQLLGLLQILLLNHQHLMFVARFAKHAELPGCRPRVAAKKASVVCLQKRMALANPIQLLLNPAGRDADDRHQHKQRPQAEPEPAAFRFGFGHGDSPRNGQGLF